MILKQENSLQGPLEGVGPENQDFLGQPPVSNGPRNGFSCIKIINFKCRVKTQVH